jgi:hypothetical protein
MHDPLFESIRLIDGSIRGAIWCNGFEFKREAESEMPEREASAQASALEREELIAIAVAMFRSGVVHSVSHDYPVEADRDWERLTFWSWACPGCGCDSLWANSAMHGCDDIDVAYEAEVDRMFDAAFGVCPVEPPPDTIDLPCPTCGTTDMHDPSCSEPKPPAFFG